MTKEMARKLTIQFITGYFEYLTQWNKSASVTSVIESLKRGRFDDGDMTELELTANFEWADTVENISDISEKRKVMTLEQFYILLISKARDRKIDDVLKHQ